MPEFNKHLRWQSYVDIGLPTDGSTPGYLITDDSIVMGAGQHVVSIDRFTGAQKYRHSVPLTPRLIGTFGGQVIIVDGEPDSTLYVLNLKTAQTQRFTKLHGYVNWLEGVGRRLYVATDKEIYLIGFAQRRWQAQKQGGFGSGTPVVNSDGLLYGVADGTDVFCFDLDTFRTRWRASLNGAAEYRPCLDGQVLYAGTGNQRTVYALDALSGGEHWRSKLPSDIVEGIAAAGDRVYAPCRDTSVYALAKTDGQLLEKVPQPGAVTSPILVNPVDNILYTATRDDVVAYAQNTRNELSYNVGPRPYLLGTNASDVYAGSGRNLCAINFTEVLKQFTIDSTLMQDFESNGAAVSKGAGLTPAPYYNTEVFLHNPDQTPLINTKVRLRSTADTTVKVGGRPYSLGRNKSVELATDGKGRLRIESKADGISTPPLLLWAPFLAATEEIVIYPDHAVHEDLAAANGDDLLAAKDYRGRPILTGQYRQDKTARDNASQAIQGALGIAIKARTGKTPKDPKAPHRRGASVTPQPVSAGAFFISDPSQLNPAVELQSDWYLNLQPGQSTFQTGISAHDVDQWAISNQSEFQTRSLVDDFWNAIERGAKVMEAFLYKTGEQILTSAKAFINGAWQYFKDIVIDTAEKAVKLVRGILNEIVESVNSAVEWLSYVFNWDAILLRHEQMKRAVLSNLDALAAGTHLDAMKTIVSSTFGELKLKMDDVFDRMRSGIGQDSFNSHKPAGGQDKLSAKSTWLVQKATQNTGMVSGAAATRSAGDDGPKLNLSVSRGVIDALNAFLRNVKNDLSEDLHQTLRQLVNGFHTMSASDIFAGTLAAILTVFQGVADMVVDVLKNFLLAILDLLKALLADGFLKNFLTAEIPIPFVKDLYRYLTGQPMSVLDIVALLVAIPLTIAERAGGNSRPQQRGIAGWAFAANIGYLIWGFADAVIEWKGGDDKGEEGMALLNQDLPWSARPWDVTLSTGLGIGIPLFLQLLLVGDVVTSTQGDHTQLAPNVVLWVLPFAAIMTDLAVAIVTKGHNLARFEIAGQITLLVIGVGTLLSIILFSIFNERFRKNTASVVANAFINLPLLFKLLRHVVVDGVKVGVYTVAGIDFFANIIGGGVGLAAAADA